MQRFERSRLARAWHYWLDVHAATVAQRVAELDAHNSRRQLEMLAAIDARRAVKV